MIHVILWHHQNIQLDPLFYKPFMHDFIDKIIDVKDDGNCEYWSVSDLLGMGQDSWSVVRNHLLKELANFSEDYIKLFGSTNKFKELRMSLHVDGLTKVFNLFF